MLQIVLQNNEVIIKDQYRLIRSTTTTVDKDGGEKKYVKHYCSFPYSFYEMLDFPKELYFYERTDGVYLTDEEPPDYYLWKKVVLQTRKNSGQKTSKENLNKKWAKTIAMPKYIMGELESYKTVHYTLYCNKKDYVANRIGLLRVDVSRKDLEDRVNL